MLGGPKTVRYRGKRPSVTFPGVPILIVAAAGALSWFAGWQLDGRLVIIGGWAVISTIGLYVLSIFRNYIKLEATDVRIATWLWSPFRKTVIPYSSIIEIMTDDGTGELTIKFVNQSGERAHAGLMLDEFSPSSVKDQIRVRQPGEIAPNLRPEATPLVVDPHDLPRGKESMKFEVWRMPRWFWVLAAGAPVVAILVLIADGFELTPLRIFGATLFFEAVALIPLISFAPRKKLEVRADRLIIAAAFERHVIHYEDIKEVKDYETGYLVVTYVKPPKLGLGGGNETASIRLLIHSESAIAAAYIQAAVERAKHSTS